MDIQIALTILVHTTKRNLWITQNVSEAAGLHIFKGDVMSHYDATDNASV